MSNKITAVIDLDPFRYAAASVGEQRSVIVTQKVTGEQWHVGTRTEFYGRKKKEDGGILAELNKGKDSPYTREDFTYDDMQTPEPLENLLYVGKMQVEGVLKALDTRKYIAVIGKGDSFRVEKSTLLKYKGNREDMLRPVYLKEVGQFLADRYNAQWCEGLEADDWVVIHSHKKKDHVVCGVDKDYYGCPTNFYNYQKPDLGIMDCHTFGKLWLNDKREVKGIGRMFFYLQMLSGDPSDNYKASCMSDLKWGDMSAYKVLQGCKNDKEAWQVLYDSFLLLYPEKKIIKGWRGDDIEIDHLYVMQEMFDMAHMLRHENDFPKVIDILKNNNVKF